MLAIVRFGEEGGQKKPQRTPCGRNRLVTWADGQKAADQMSAYGEKRTSQVGAITPVFDPKLPSLGCGAVCKIGTPGRSALAERPRLLPFVALIFFVFLEFGFFF